MPAPVRRCAARAFPAFAGVRHHRPKHAVAKASVLVKSEPDSSSEGADAAGMDDLYSRFDQLLQGTVASFKPGDVVRGEVVDVDRKEALIDIGGKGAAACQCLEVSSVPVNAVYEVLRVGMVRDFTVLGERNEIVNLSLASAQRVLSWTRLRQLQQRDVTVCGTVSSTNKGGAVVTVMNTPGFVPNSHLTQSSDTLEMGQEIALKILEVNEEGGQVLLSSRQVQAGDILNKYRIGDVVEGTVMKVMMYGAFVDVGGGVSGLLHVSQISHERVTDIEKIITPGDKMKLMVMAFDRERGRLALTTKKLEPMPGDMLRDPQKVFDRADQMAELFKFRVQQAEQAAREEEARARGLLGEGAADQQGSAPEGGDQAPAAVVDPNQQGTGGQAA